MEDFRHEPSSDNEIEYEVYNPEIELSNMEDKLKIVWDEVLNPYVSSINLKEILHRVQENDFHFLWRFYLDNNLLASTLLSDIRKQN